MRQALTHITLFSAGHQPVEVHSFLEMFPREDYRDATIQVVKNHYARIPKTERFIFTCMASNGIDDKGEPLISFLVGEEQEAGAPKIHAMQLYQSWRERLTEFLETPGAKGGRFYAELRLADPKTSIRFPEDGTYVRLEIQDLLVKQPWTEHVFVRKESYAGTRLLNGLTEDFSKAVIDLEWLKGPTGDAFINVSGIHSSDWGDFPK